MSSATITVERENANLFDNDFFETGTLTDEHAASSYGLPVVVLDGTAYGPADLGARTIRVQHAYAPSKLAPELYESDEQLRARRLPETIALECAARAAGYRVG